MSFISSSTSSLSRFNAGIGRMKTLLIVYHSRTGGTRQMAEAAATGAAAEPALMCACWRRPPPDPTMCLPPMARSSPRRRTSPRLPIAGMP